jgi:hypothetical protein
MSVDLALCATDLSLEESTAWRSAARLVQALNARARILHVIEPVTFPYAEGPGRDEDPAGPATIASSTRAYPWLRG